MSLRDVIDELTGPAGYRVQRTVHESDEALVVEVAEDRPFADVFRVEVRLVSSGAAREALSRELFPTKES